MKKLISIFISVIIFFGSFTDSLALYDPLSIKNNKFGIHIMNENDLIDAAYLVNSTGGDWGYVTFVITESERNHNRWQKVFDEMRRQHLIPIVRIATKPQDGIWQVPQESEINNWVAFLNSLNWVVENRYIIIGNEPNHAKEWGGKVSPFMYADYLKAISVALKSVNSDFYILPAGLDASAPNSKLTMSETNFLEAMITHDPEIFNYIDGWNSHSYPNPGFSGKASDSGRGTVTTFVWELNYLKSLGVTKSLPVFITETGWSNKNLSEKDISDKFTYAFEKVWSDKKIVSITPFILNYTSPPFREFSWKKDDNSFYAFYDSVRNLPKIKGEPRQIVKGKIVGVFINPFVIAGSSLKGVVLAQNLGQSIWVEPMITLDDESKNISFNLDSYDEVEPDKFRLLHLSTQSIQKAGIYKVPLSLQYNGKNIGPSYPIEIFVLKPPEVKKEGIFGKIRKFMGR